MEHVISNVLKGERVGNIAFGQRLAGDWHHFEPDPLEQAALAALRWLRSQRTTLLGIATALNHGSYLTRRGTPWRLKARQSDVTPASQE